MSRLRTRFKDNFREDDYSLADAETSPNDEWICAYTGFGDVGVITDGGNKVMRICPDVPANPEDPASTRASRIETVRSVYDFECTFDMKTVNPTRVGPNNWECGWFMWHYTATNHHYYMYIQRDGGIEVGKKDFPEVIEQQVFLEVTNNTSPTWTENVWQRVKIRMVGYNIKIWVDGILYVDITDDGTIGNLNGSLPPAPSPDMLYGKCSFYTEDANVHFRNFLMRAL